jgi:transcriptional regulator with XRE-family HTH domain
MQRLESQDRHHAARWRNRHQRGWSVPHAVRPASYQRRSGVRYLGPMVGTQRTARGNSEWAKYVRNAVMECQANVSLLRQRSGVSRSSIYRWLADDGTRVTIDSARKIARAIGDDPSNAIRAAGALLDRGNDGLGGLDPNDPVVAHILNLEVDEEMREMMLDRYRENLEHDRQRYIEQARRDAEYFRRRAAG